MTRCCMLLCRRQLGHGCRVFGSVCSKSSPQVASGTSFTIQSSDRAEQARSCKLVRKEGLKDYKCNVVKPILIDYDRRAFLKSAETKLLGTGLSFSSFHAEPCRFPVEFFSGTQDKLSWRKYRAWAISRCSGRWPLTVLGGMRCRLSYHFALSVVHLR